MFEVVVCGLIGLSFWGSYTLLRMLAHQQKRVDTLEAVLADRAPDQIAAAKKTQEIEHG